MNSVTRPPGRVVLVLGSSTAGACRHVAALAGGLLEQGWNVTVCGPASVDGVWGFSAAGTEFCAVEIPATARVGDAAAVRALRTVLRDRDGTRRRRGTAGIAVVHAHGLRAGLIAALARPAACPLVVTWHSPVVAEGLRGQVYRRIERYVARAADVTLAVSGDLVARARVLGARRVLPASIPAPPLLPAVRTAAEVRRELGVATGQPLVLAAGRLHPQKGYEVLIAAAARWAARRPRPVVVIAGAGPAENDLVRRIADTGAPVTLLGYRTDVPDLLVAADVVVATSVWEGQPLFVQEALRAGAPLVATAVGGVPDVAGDAALLVPAGDIGAVEEAVVRLLDDPQLRAEYARRGPLRAAAWPTTQDAVAEAVGIYAGLAGAHGTDGVSRSAEPGSEPPDCWS